MSTNQWTEWNWVPNTLNGVYLHLMSFWHAFWTRPSWCDTFLHDLFHLKLHTPFVQNWGTKWTQCRTPWMGFVCTLTHFSMHFMSIWVGVRLSSTRGSIRMYKLHDRRNLGMQWNREPTPRVMFICVLAHFDMYYESIHVGVKLSSTTGSTGQIKLQAHKISARTEIVYQTPRMEFICVLSHFGMHFKSVWVGVKPSTTMDSSWNYKLHLYEIEARNETEYQIPRMEFACTLASSLWRAFWIRLSQCEPLL